MQACSPHEPDPAADLASRGRPRWLAIALDQIPADEETAALVRGAQVGAIVRLTPLVMAASCVNAAILLAFFDALDVLRLQHWIWAIVFLALALGHMRAWRSRRRRPKRTASRRTIRRLVLNGAALGAVWGYIPAVTFAGAPTPVQLFVTCMTAGMMAAGSFVLTPAPLAAMSYVLVMAAGAEVALWRPYSAVHLAMTGLLISYVAVLLGNINWGAALFVDSRLAEAQVRREVAAREEAQAQAAHAERMTAIGELAGGIAHDINNILQVVSGSAARIERDPANSQEVARQTRRIQAAVERGSAISRRLLAFARRDSLRAEVIDSAALVGEVGELLRHAIGPPIKVQVDLAKAASCVLADRNQLETVLLNLATNGRDAMPEGGTLTLSAASSVVEERPGLRGGRYVSFSVADTGTGIDPAILGRVVEPFFTTKPKGQGTGLGLSMAKGFAEQSGGALAISSEVGGGTTVTLWLPEAEAPASRAKGMAAETAAGEGPVAGRRIMIVDDDPLVRDGLISAFQDLGFVTLGAEDASRALALLDGDVEIDGLVTDFSMPGMNGLELIHAIHARKPGLPAVLFTGHMSEVSAAGFGRLKDETFALLYKPMAPAKVAERLAAVIDGI